MDADAHESESEPTEVVIGAGFLEKVYERALIYELALRGVSAKAQVSFPISYKGKYLGEYVADLVVGETGVVAAGSGWKATPRPERPDPTGSHCAGEFPHQFIWALHW